MHNYDFAKLTSLPNDAPKYAGDNFWCNDNKLTSLQGSPKYVGGNFDCDNNKLTSLQYAPKYVGGNFYCHNNTKKFTEKEVRTVCDVKGNIYV
jgi:hypothetical protein